MKKFFSGRVKMILAAAMSLAILFAVVGVISDGATLGQQVTGLVLSPFRAAAAAVVRQVEQFYDYLFRYDALEAENELLKQRVAELEEDARDVAQYERGKRIPYSPAGTPGGPSGFHLPFGLRHQLGVLQLENGLHDFPRHRGRY